jgi:hypothetical protein
LRLKPCQHWFVTFHEVAIIVEKKAFSTKNGYICTPVVKKTKGFDEK